MEATEQAFRIFANGTDMGTYWGMTRRDAENAYARDAGYDSFRALRKEHDGQITVRPARDDEIDSPDV